MWPALNYFLLSSHKNGTRRRSACDAEVPQVESFASIHVKSYRRRDSALIPIDFFTSSLACFDHTSFSVYNPVYLSCPDRGGTPAIRDAKTPLRISNWKSPKTHTSWLMVTLRRVASPIHRASYGILNAFLHSWVWIHEAVGSRRVWILPFTWHYWTRRHEAKASTGALSKNRRCDSKSSQPQPSGRQTACRSKTATTH